MGNAKHKKQYSTLRATTLLDPSSVADIAKQTTHSIRDNIPSMLPGGAFVRFEEADSGKLRFTIRGGGYRWSTKPVMEFIVNLTPDGTGRTAVNTRITSFRTDQTMAYFFIPISPKTLEGYAIYKRFVEQLAAALAQRDPYTRAALIERPNHPEEVLAAGPTSSPAQSFAPQFGDERPRTPDGYRDSHHDDTTADYRRHTAEHFTGQTPGVDAEEATTAPIPLCPPTSPSAIADDSGPPPSPTPAPLRRSRSTGPNSRAGFRIDPTALTVAGAAMGIDLMLWTLKQALTGIFGGASGIIALFLLGCGGYVIYRGRKPEQAHRLEARLQRLTQDAAHRVSSVAANGVAPPLTSFRRGGVARAPEQSPGRLSGTGSRQESAGMAALVSAALLIPSFIAYAWQYRPAGFTDPWGPWWILTGLHLYFVFCVASRARTGSRRPLAALLGLLGTGLIALANNPSGSVNLTAMLSTKQYYDGDSYLAPPSPEVVAWIVRVPTLAILLFVAAWGLARRSQPGWVLGLIPTGLLVWWSIYGTEHGFGADGGWFGAWLMSVGVFVGGTICCCLAELLTAPRDVTSAVPGYAPPLWTRPPGSSDIPSELAPDGQARTHADYHEQAVRHFHGERQPNPTSYPGRPHSPPG